MGRAGFTLIELLVVVLIVGVLGAIAVPQYMRTTEHARADMGQAMIVRVSAANRMYKAEKGAFVTGRVTSACNTATCPASTEPCSLIGCGYLAKQDWDKAHYIVFAGDGATCGDGVVATSGVGCGRRRRAADTPATNGTSLTPYTGWGYSVATDGIITAQGEAPPPKE